MSKYDWYHLMGWKQLDISIADAEKWKALINDPDIVAGWLACGFSSEEAEPFIEYDKYAFSPNEVRNWLEAGASYDDIIRCSLDGISLFSYLTENKIETDGYYGI